MAPDSAVTPTIRSGRMIEHAGEIVLGTATIAQLHKSLGDTVSSSSGELRIVGTATFPSIGVVHGDHTSLGVGGIVATEQVPDWDRNLHFTGADPAAYGPNVLFVRYRDGADAGAVTARMEQLAPQISDYNGVVVTPVQRSAEIVNADDIGGSARLLGVAVAAAALASLTVAFNAAVRRRRRDLALLKTVGFTRRQLGWVVVWQATGTMALGLLIGIPAGWLLGRSLWRQFAVQLDVLAAPAAPAFALLAIALGGVAVANLLAAAPARHARRVPAALVLRSE
jgi:hypothetical protein